jgi:ATP/maltotriose-dependent transcriptional regulator MalT
MLHQQGKTSEGIALLRSEQMPPGAEPDRLTANIGVPAAEFAIWSGQPALAVKIAERAARDGETLGIANVQAAARTWQGLGHLLELDLPKARTALGYAITNRSKIGMLPEREAMLCGAMALQLSGRTPEAVALVDRFLAETKEQRDAVWRAGALTFRARLAALAGDKAEARQWLQEAERLDAVAAMPFIEDPALTRLQIMLQGGREGGEMAARALPAVIEDAEARHDVPNAIRGWLLLAVAQSSRDQGTTAAARAALREAMDRARPGGVLLPFAELRGSLSRLLRSAGPEGIALASAVDEALGAESRGATFGLRLLTAREEQVLAALGEGLTRKEIAERYSLSPATVKRHMEKIYAKLGVSSREEAVAARR